MVLLFVTEHKKYNYKFSKRLTQRMSVYYDKINMYFKLKQQRSHYKRIVEVKKNIDFQKFQHQMGKHTKPSKKSQSQKERQIRENNQRMYARLQSIRNQDGLLQCIQKQDGKKETKSGGKFLQQNSHNCEKINQQNMRIIQRLSQVKPIVGTRSNWIKQFKKSRSIEKNLHKFVRNQSIDPQQYIRETMTSIARRKTQNRKIHTSLTYNEPCETQNFTSVVRQEENKKQYIEAALKEKQQNMQKRPKHKRKYRRSLKSVSKHRSDSLKFNINQIILGMGPNFEEGEGRLKQKQFQSKSTNKS